MPKDDVSLQIIMANKPRMLREMLGRILSRPEQVNVIGEVYQLNRLPLIVEMLHPDWIVVTLCKNDTFPAVVDDILEKDQEIGVLAVSERGDKALVRCGDITFEGMALDELVNMIKSKRNKAQANFNSC